MGKRSGLYTGVTYKNFGPGGWASADSYLDRVLTSGNTQAIVSIVMVPSGLFSPNMETARQRMFVAPKPANLNGYVPHNKKLFTFPYCSCVIDTLEAQGVFKYEQINGAQVNVMTVGVTSPVPQLLVALKNYNGVNSDNSGLCDPTTAVIMKEFPQCAFPIDGYRAWMAQKSTLFDLEQRKMSNTILAQQLNRDISKWQGIGNAAVQGLSLNVVGAANTGANTVKDYISREAAIANNQIGMEQNQIAAGIEMATSDSVKGSQDGSAFVGSGTQDIYVKQMTITKEKAEIIDAFFDVYGYASGKLKKPNTMVRPAWTYTQTRDCNVGGNVPASVKLKLNSIFNAGITFWANPSKIGDYSQDNSPLPPAEMEALWQSATN